MDILKQIVFIKIKNKNVEVKLPQIHFILGVSTVVVKRHPDFCNKEELLRHTRLNTEYSFRVTYCNILFLNTFAVNSEI